jgi:hypothetical protein
MRIEVLNGCGVRGAAKAAASILRAGEGFDVVTIGNADGVRIGSTLVLDRVGAGVEAERVARALGVDRDAVLFQRPIAGRVDVTVIVGYDQGRWDEPLTDR